MAAMAEARRQADAQDPRPARLLRRVARHPGRRPHARPPHPVDRRPQRHGQDHALQHHRRAEAGASSGSIAFAGREIAAARPARDRAARRRLRAAGTAGVAEPYGRRAPAARRRATAATRPGRSSASTRRFRSSPSGAQTAARSSPAASSRCWRSRGRCSAIRGSSSWTSRPRASRRSSSSSSETMLVAPRRGRRDRGAPHRAEHRRRDTQSPRTSPSWSTAASTGSCRRASLPPTATCSSGSSASAAMRDAPSGGACACRGRATRRRALPRCSSVVRGGDGARQRWPTGRRRRAIRHGRVAAQSLVAAGAELGRGVRAPGRSRRSGRAEARRRAASSRFRRPSGTAARRSWSAPSTPRAAS